MREVCRAHAVDCPANKKPGVLRMGVWACGIPPQERSPPSSWQQVVTGQQGAIVWAYILPLVREALECIADANHRHLERAQGRKGARDTRSIHLARDTRSMHLARGTRSIHLARDTRSIHPASQGVSHQPNHRRLKRQQRMRVHCAHAWIYSETRAEGY